MSAFKLKEATVLVGFSDPVRLGAYTTVGLTDVYSTKSITLSFIIWLKEPSDDERMYLAQALDPVVGFEREAYT